MIFRIKIAQYSKEGDYQDCKDPEDCFTRKYEVLSCIELKSRILKHAVDSKYEIDPQMIDEEKAFYVSNKEGKFRFYTWEFI